MNSLLPFFLPLGALIAVATVMISLGILFTVVGSAGTIAVGLGIIVIVPLVGMLLTRSGRETSA